MSAISANSVLDLIKNRRTYYPLSKDLPISKERVSEIVKEAVLHTPSSFNAQSNRVVVLFGADHEKLWDIATEILKAIVPADAFQATADKMNMFKGAAGTVSSRSLALHHPPSPPPSTPTLEFGKSSARRGSKLVPHYMIHTPCCYPSILLCPPTPITMPPHSFFWQYC